MKRKLVLENGMVFYGEGFGSGAERIAEIVFHTAMVGYQEIISDPSCSDQMIVMSYPLIGNYGLTDDDYESKGVYLSGFIVHEYNDLPSNFRYTKTLGDVLNEHNVPGIAGVDTRALVRIIRDNGSMKALITDADTPEEECLAKLTAYELPTNQVAKVSCKKVWYSRTKNPLYTIVAVDCGIKLNIIRELNRYGCNVVVVPYQTKKDDILKYHPDGILISNGPGNPKYVPEVINLIRELRGKIPLFGICLGFQLISLACGASVYKMKFGHRGANHPVKNILTNKVHITSQNHSYAIDPKSLEETGLTLSHLNLLDQGVEGVCSEKDDILAVQFHPEGAAGPDDSAYIFADFMAILKRRGGK